MATGMQQQQQQPVLESVAVHAGIGGPTAVLSSVAASTTSQPSAQLELNKMEKILHNDQQLQQQIENVFQHATAQPAPSVGMGNTGGVGLVAGASSSAQSQVHSQMLAQNQQQSTTMSLNQPNLPQ